MADFASYLTYGVKKANKPSDFKLSLPGNGISNDLGKYFARGIAGAPTPKSTKNKSPKVNIYAACSFIN